MREVPESKGFIYEFGNFVLDPQERVLFSDGQPVHLAEKVFDTLLLLIEHNGRLVTKDEMLASIWDESFVEEGNVAKNVSRLRKILNANGEELIETLPRRGYRFLGDVNALDPGTNLLVRRNLKVKITQTVDDAPGWRTLLIGGAGFFGLAIYFGRHDSTVSARSEGMSGATRLTRDAGNQGHPSWTADGRIRYLRTGVDRQTHSFIMNADGTEQTAAEDFKGLQQGIWSPNGQKVIFAKPTDTTAFHLANSDGSGEVILPFYGGNSDWSADSSKIVYQKTVNVPNPDIFVYSVETGQSTKLTNDVGFNADPSFSPDGKQIVFASLRDGNAEIYLMNSDGRDVRRLTNDPAWDNHPVFSPDGTQISFDSDRDNETSDIYLMRADGSDIRRLVDWKSNESAENGCWSPDGTKLAFTSDRNGNDDIYVISAQAYPEHLVLADEGANLRNPVLSPDGKRIAYEAELADHSGELRVFDIAGKRSGIVLKTDKADTSPVWSPDGNWIAFQQYIGSNTEICVMHPDGGETRTAAR